MHKKVKELAVEVLGGPSLQASSGLRQREERKPYIWIVNIPRRSKL
jgi:hypothetical protein